jgi:cell wall-associated NlpC family hydrolase
MLIPPPDDRTATTRATCNYVINFLLLAAVAAGGAAAAFGPREPRIEPAVTAEPSQSLPTMLATQSAAPAESSRTATAPTTASQLIPPTGSVRLTYIQARGNPSAAVAYALRQRGTPYLWGATGNGGFDCSGLVMRAWQAGGVYLPRTTYQMARVGTRITRSQLQPGDLIFSNNFGHVQLYIGGGQIVQAARPGTVVSTGPLPYASRVNAYTRVRWL